MDLRTVTGLPNAVSVVGVHLEALAPPGLAPVPPLFEGLVRRAVDLGVNLFDLTSAPSARRLAIGLASALPAIPDSLVFVDSAPPEAARRAPERARAEVRDLVGLLRGHPLDVLLLPAPTAGWEPAEFVAPLVSAGSVRAWGISLPAFPENVPERLGTTGARLVAVPYHALDPIPALPLLRHCQESGLAVFVTDPHAGGRLDGSVLERPLLAGGQPPPRLSELRARYGAVLGLGFLTEGRRRTLAQAAVQFALAAPGVAAAIVGPNGPRALEEMAHAPQCPPLTRADIERILRQGAGEPPAG
jgi:aryl-alcohol dehydrogenase-like predicted oxidoreductase